MPQELDDTTAAEFGHALLRWVVDDDPAGIGKFLPDLEPGRVDDARAGRIGRTLGDLLQNIEVA